MASNNSANLFGEDTDGSSDESVSANKTATRTKIGDDDSSSDGEPKKKQQAAAAVGDGGGGGDDDTKDDAPKASSGGEEKANSNNDSQEPTKDDENIGEDEGAKDDDDGSDDEGEKEKPPADGAAAASSNSGTTPSKNSALFGDDDESSEDDEFDGDDGIVGRAGGVAKPTAPVVGKSMNEKLGLDSDSDEDMAKEGTKSSEGDKEEEAKPKYVPPRRMELQDLDIKKNGNNEKSNVTYHITKLPNLVGINPTAYNAETHDMEKEEEEYRGYVHNMIRWRYKTNEAGEYVRDEDGNPVRESNTRLVKWSDGSITLHVGQELLEVDNLDSSVPADNPDKSVAGFAGINGYMYVSQKAKIRPPTKKEMEGPPEEGEAYNESDLENEEDRPPAKPAGTVLECIGTIASRLALRPSSLASDAHRNLKLAVQKRNVKRARIAEIVTEVDPEKEKQARIKGKEDLAKSRARSSSGGKRSSGGGGRRRGMNASYLEEEEDYDGVNISRLKKQTMRRGDYSDENEEEMDYGEDSEEDEEAWMSKKKRKRGAAAARAARAPAASKMDESSEEGEVVFGDDDDDDEEDAFVKKRGGGAKKAVFGDDDDD